jgi:serine/threonine-protein kinase
MASVYKAHDLNLHRSVAIKVIHPHLTFNPEFLHRFEAEATSVAHLRHPNIVQMFDYNHDGDLYYMVMEFVMGETLQTRLKRLNASRRRLTFKEVTTFTTEICEAAHYAHQRGMIHRDIKPANIMLDFNGKAILMDFGIARMVNASQHTAAGVVLGTALYMSPEQIQGLQIDARADIYSIGITLFELLSGKPPFEDDSAMTLMMMHLNDPVPDLLDLQPDTPSELVAITNKALVKNRDERYQSASEMATALRKIPDQPQRPPVAVTPPLPSLPESHEVTLIEAPVVKAAGETFLEAPVLPAPVKEVSKPVPPSTKPSPADLQYQPTLVEQAVQPVQTITKTATKDIPGKMPVERKKSKAWVPISLVLLILILGGGGIFAFTKFFPGSSLSSSPSPTAETVALVPVSGADEAALEKTPTLQRTATETPQATSTEDPTATPAAVLIGGADKIAFLSGRNVWVANLDGTELTQLTQNNTEKIYMRWLPDGQGLSYISGKCIESVSLMGEISQITCFNTADTLESFEVSPDGKQVVIGLDRQVYLVPFDLENLSQATSTNSLSAQATCANLTPYTRNTARFVRWSRDSTRWAVVAQVPYNGLVADIVAVFPIDNCYPDTYAAFEAQFPPPHFTYPGYEKYPSIQDLGFDGNYLFALHGLTRNGGFGDLHLFNMETFKFHESVNPINNTCCYRDIDFSPDGSYLVFAYQDITLGEASTTRLYYIPFGSIGTGEKYEPMPLPEITDPKERPQPVLRPVNR